MLLNICPKNYSKLLLSYLGCPIEPIQGSSQLVREVLNWSKESFVIAKRGNVLPCVRALSLPLNLTLNLPASYPGNWLLLLHSLIPPHTQIVTVSLYLRLHPPDYSNNARLSRLLGLEFTSTCCACCGAGVRLGRLEELQGGAPSHRARIAGRTHTPCCAQLRVKLLPYSHWCTCLCTTQCSTLYLVFSWRMFTWWRQLDQQCWCRRPFTTQGDHKVPAKDWYTGTTSGFWYKMKKRYEAWN